MAASTNCISFCHMNLNNSVFLIFATEYYIFLICYTNTCNEIYHLSYLIFVLLSCLTYLSIKIPFYFVISLRLIDHRLIAMLYWVVVELTTTTCCWLNPACNMYSSSRHFLIPWTGGAFAPLGPFLCPTTEEKITAVNCYVILSFYWNNSIQVK